MEAALKIKRDAEEMNEHLKGLMDWSEKQKKLDHELKDASGNKAAVDEVVQRNIDAFSNPLEASDVGAPAGKKGKGSAFSLLSRSKQSARGKGQNAGANGKVKPPKSDPPTPDQIPAVRASQAASSSAAETTAITPEMQADADKHRERGNRLFQKGDLLAARDAYTASVAAAPGAAALANRALMALKLKQWAPAEADASAAIQLDAGAWKAWQRRGAARLQMGTPEKALAAVEDLEAALRLQPGSRALASERAAAVATYHALPGAAPRPSARRDVHVVPATATAAASAASPAAVASPSAGGGPSAGHGSQASSAPRETASGAADARPSAEGGAPVARSPAPAAAKLPSLAAPRELHSGCEIEEMVEEIPVEEPTPPPAPSSAAARQPGSGAGVGRHAPARAEGAATGDSSSPSPQQTAPSPAQQPPTRARAQAAPPAPGSGPDTAPRGAPVGVHPGSAEAPTGAAPAADVHPPQSTADGAQVPEAAASAAAPGSSGPAQSAPVAPRGSAGPASLEAAAAFAAAQMKLSKPRSGVEFERTWRMLLSQPEQQAAYLEMLEPGSLPQLLRTQLTAPLLESLLPPLLRAAAASPARPAAGAHALALLRALPALPRFALVAMSVPPSHRGPMAALWDGAAAKLAAAGGSCGQDAHQLLGLLRPQFAAVL